MLYYSVNAICIFCIIDLLFFDYRRGLYLLAMIIPCSSMFAKAGIAGLNLTTLIVIAAFVRPILRRKFGELFAGGHITRPILFLMLITILSSICVELFTSIPGYNIWNVMAFLKGWFSFILLYIIYEGEFDSKRELRYVFVFVLLGVLIQDTVAIKELIFQNNRRLHGLIGNSNNLGSFFAAYTFLCILGYRYLGGMWKIASVLGVALSMIAMGFALSRGAWLAFFAAMSFFIWKKSKRVVLIAFVIVFFFSSVAYDRLPSKIKDRIEMTFQDEESQKYQNDVNPYGLEPSAFFRIPLAIGGLKMFAESPVWGKGFCTFHLIGMNYYGDMGVPRGFVAHNMYIQILAELGIIGFVPFMLILYRNTMLGLRLNRRGVVDEYANDMGLVLVCINITFAISCLFGNRLFNGNLTAYYWIFTAITYRYSLLIEREECTGEE